MIVEMSELLALLVKDFSKNLGCRFSKKCIFIIMHKFRPNVAAIIMNRKGEILVCERKKDRGAWQFPQG